MKQVTGSNLSVEFFRELSIQNTLDGFSFCVADRRADFYEVYPFPSQDQFQKIYVCWVTPAVTLIPEAEFDPDLCENYLEALNLLTPYHSTLYNRNLTNGIVTVWQVPTAELDQISEHYPEAIHYHPLQLAILSPQREAIRVILQENHAQIAVFDRQTLRAAQSFRIENLEDLLYYIKTMAAEDRFSRYSLSLTSDREEAGVFLNPYFPVMTEHIVENYNQKQILVCEL